MLNWRRLLNKLVKITGMHIFGESGLDIDICCSVTKLTLCNPIAAHQSSLSFTISLSLLKLMSIELVILSNHLILCQQLLLLPSIFPSIRSFPMSQLSTSGGQSIGASASASTLPMNTQGWFPLGLTGLSSLQCKGLSRAFSSSAIQKHQIKLYY